MTVPSSPLRSLPRWCREGARTVLFRAPRWQGLETSPYLIAALVLLGLAVTIGYERLYIDGAAAFNWQAIGLGWIRVVLVGWACYLVCAGRSDGPGTARLLTMALAQKVVYALAFGAVFTVMVRKGWYDEAVLGEWGMWAAWILPALWIMWAQLALLRRSGAPGLAASLCATLAIVLATAFTYDSNRDSFWYPVGDPEQGAAPELKLTQALMERQPELLAKQLQDLAPERPGRTDLYTLTFAPHAEDVFRRESAMVTDVMGHRFDAKGRSVELVNHTQTGEILPWATPLNLRRAIDRFAEVMDRENDILFIHLTSHGAADGELAASLWPLQVDALHPRELKQWLDEAGIRNRVVSVSACFSGSWIEPLADDNTLVMTAADAEHTSYGCGSKSELTFFGRAMYDEQLRNRTLSFEQAYKAAREVIARREIEAGKDDGYSNPQIRVGAAIRGKLATLQRELAAPAR